MPESASFGLLGPVSARIGDRAVSIGGPRSQAVLAVLLLEPNRAVSLDRIVAGAWGDEPPDGTRVQAQNRVSGLRRALQTAGDVIQTSGTGYLITADAGSLDTLAFDEAVQRARQLQAADRLDEAATELTAALRLWRGSALDGLQTPRLTAAARRLDESRIAAQEQLIDLELRRGRYEEVTGELVELVAAHPFRERPIAQLMTALHRSGRQYEALALFDATRRRLAAELGIDPGAELVGLRDQILRDEPASPPASPVARPAVAVAPEPPAASAPTGSVVDGPVMTETPQLLPRSVPDFVGRAHQVDLIDSAARADDTSPLCLLTGTAGSGKTALAIHWAHRSRHRFPDGALFVNLRGYGPGEPARPADALAVFLQALGLAPERVPYDDDLAAGMFRSRVAGRRMIIVIDNAASAEQVRPLLPAGGGCVVLVTSRDRLDGLTALDGARRIPVPTLDPAEAVDLLGRLVGAARIRSEPRAAAELAAACAHLPLALRIAAALTTDDGPLSATVPLLHGAAALDALRLAEDGSAAVRTAFDRSYARLDPAVAHMFRLLGLLPGPDFSAETAAAVAGVSAGRAAQLLDRLHAAHLVERAGTDRYAMHDLLREYSGACLAEDPTPGVRANAVHRLSAHLAGRTEAAAALVYPTAIRLPPLSTVDNAGPGFADRAAALAWLEVEQPTLVAAAVSAAASGVPSLAWRLADALRSYFWMRRATADWEVTARAGLAAATAADDRMAQAACALALGMAFVNAGRHGKAVTVLREAMALSQAAGWPEAEASVLGNLGIAYSELGQLGRAVEQYRRALVVNETLGRAWSRANNLGNLGLLQIRMGQFRPAAEHLAEATAVHRDEGDRHNFSVFLHGLGQAYRYLCRFDDAVAALTESVEVCRALGDVHEEAVVLGDLATLHADLGQFDLATEHAEAAVRIAELSEESDVRAMALIARAAVALLSAAQKAGSLVDSDTDRAAADAAEAIGLATESGNEYVGLLARTVAAAAGLGRGRRVDVATSTTEIAEAAARAGFGHVEASALLVLAASLGASRPAFLAAIHRATEAHRTTGCRLGEARALLLAGRAGQAAELAEAEAILAELGLPETPALPVF